mmetsp:Transcript_459/g.1299  ORF Transcript_459/g.1299 Transcript_459/m.1299 type:complete len:223 (+) Transcript_459:937-1605(+)
MMLVVAVAPPRGRAALDEPLEDGLDGVVHCERLGDAIVTAVMLDPATSRPRHTNGDAGQRKAGGHRSVHTEEIPGDDYQHCYLEHPVRQDAVVCLEEPTLLPLLDHVPEILDDWGVGILANVSVVLVLGYCLQCVEHLSGLGRLEVKCCEGVGGILIQVEVNDLPPWVAGGEVGNIVKAVGDPNDLLGRGPARRLCGRCAIAKPLPPPQIAAFAHCSVRPDE